ncbi:hypothetical protein EVAR_23835_1 [Eumeta japonica]|uniref:Uncharacterized protein n=1 Tax=Eumeta variegata TaxID=151549 RepID=A0A4C1VNM8_EUMVA|nr:hypothetical protein EVAR_23835_1 [Eumeta japonica]
MSKNSCAFMLRPTEGLVALKLDEKIKFFCSQPLSAENVTAGVEFLELFHDSVPRKLQEVETEARNENENLRVSRPFRYSYISDASESTLALKAGLYYIDELD